MDITMVRLGPLVAEIKLLREAVVRLVELKEVELKASGALRLATGKRGKAEDDMIEVSYTDPEVEMMVDLLARAGREEDAEKLRAAAEKL